MVHYHYLWLKNHCDPSCNEKKVSERIEFYNKQPIKHTLFNSVIFHKDIIIPYTSQSLRKCLEHSCRNIQGEHEVIYELTYSEKNPELSETINKIILKDRNKFFSKYIDDGLYETADSSDENNIKIYFNKIITIKNYHSSYYHGGAHAYGGTYTKHFTKIVGMINVTSLYAGNPISLLISIVGLARSYHRVKNKKETTKSWILALSKGGAISTASIILMSLLGPVIWTSLIIIIITGMIYNKNNIKINWDYVSKFIEETMDQKSNQATK